MIVVFLEQSVEISLSRRRRDLSSVQPLGGKKRPLLAEEVDEGWQEALGADKQPFAWPPVAVISQREALISEKVLSLLAFIYCCLLCQKGTSLYI